MLTDSLVSQCDAPQDEIKLEMAEQLKSAVTDIWETRPCMFLRDGRSRARLLSTYNWPQKLSLGYLMLKPHSEATAGLVTSCATEKGVWDGDRRTPKMRSGWPGSCWSDATKSLRSQHLSSVSAAHHVGCTSSLLCEGCRVSIWVRTPPKYLKTFFNPSLPDLFPLSGQCCCITSVEASHSPPSSCDTPYSPVQRQHLP